MKHKKVIILSITVGVLLILLVGIGLVFWNINSYTAGNWLVESRVREYIGNAYPDLDYEIVSRDIYETEEDGDRVLIVWEFDIKCEDEMHTLYFTSNQTREREPLFFNVADYAQIRFDCEGNTRTTAVFFIKYLRSMGFDVTNDVFAKNAWYFRNSLVRANYRNVKNGVYEDMSFLETFLRNLLLGEHNELKNRYMHIRWEETTHSTSKQHIEQHIGRHIPDKNSILNLLDTKEISSKIKNNITKLYETFGMEKIFGRSDVIEALGITERPASTLLGKMYSLGLTEKITGAGKGKYRFIV